MQFLYTKLTLYIFWKDLCHFFSLFEGRGRGRQHIYARLGTGCRDLQCCHQLCGEGKDTADAFAFDVLRLLGFVASKTGRNPKKPGFLTNDFKLQSIFWFLLLWLQGVVAHWHEIRVNCDELRLLSQKWIQDFHQTGCPTKGTLSQHTAAPGCGNPAYRCLLRCHNERLHQIPLPLQRPWPLQNGVRQSNYCRTSIVRVDVVGLDIFLFWLPCSKYGTLPHLCYTLICGSLSSWPAL